MYLKRLEIVGFKTFAARTVFEFQPGITAIIGPNGSGKSNVADAVRWVLGEQSYAALRSRRAEDLIFGGGGRRAPSGFAEVSLTIDNSDRLLPLPYSEVTITRRSTRAGEHEYQLNRARVRLRDVLEAVGPLGGSYTVINQGLVDAALNLRPEERRRLFEDAAEIGTYEQRKAETERRLRETAANIQRCEDVLADLEPRLRSLKRQAALARTLRDLQAELRVLLVQFYQIQRQAAHAARAAANARERDATVVLAARGAEQQLAVAELAALRDAMRALRERLGGLHAASGALHDRAEALQRDLAVGVERAAAQQRRADDLERSRRDVETQQAEVERERAAITARLADAEERFRAEQAATHAQQAVLAAREAERRVAREALDRAQRAELTASAALADVRRRGEQHAARRVRLDHEQRALAPALAAAEEALQTQQGLQAEAEGRVEQRSAVLGEVQAGLERARAAIDGLRTELARADELLSQERRALADDEARLESLLRLQRSYVGVFAGVKAAMQWAESQRRSGFVLVSSLIRTPAELETAIEVALGSRLQNIVVERWSDAEAAIDALKRSGAGRATFLPLDSIRGPGGQREAREPNGAGVLGVAAVLVEYDDPYRAVVQQLLGRTLVVQDLVTARRELHGMGSGWTIVTLAGEQVSSAGAVTGGAQIRESGALRRERELRDLPRQIESRRATIEQHVAARSALAGRLDTAEHTRRTAEQDVRMAQREVDAARDGLDRARRAVSQAASDLDLQRRRSGQIAADLAELADQSALLATERADLETREAAARAAFEQLRAEEQARAEQDQEAQTVLAGLRARANEAEAAVRAEQALLQANARNGARLVEQQATIVQRMHELHQERAALGERNQQLEATHAALLAEIDTLRRQIEPAEAEGVAGEQSTALLEQRTSELTRALLDAESAHGRAAIDVQRAADRLDALWERAAADDVDLDALPEGDDSEQAEQGPTTAGESTAPEDIGTRVQQLRTRIQRLGVVNPLALEEYEQSSERYEFLSAQLSDLRGAQNAMAELIAELESAMQARFEATFTAVAAEFEKTFERLFGGGEARLVLTRPAGAPESNGEQNGHEPTSSALMGVDIVARPPGKRQQNLALLSGGERALTAGALLFAILKVNPSPFCVMDEVDAALDEANVGRFREVLVELARETQFLVVTHNRGTIEAADTIYGVSMGDDSASRVLSLRLDELVEE